MKIKTKLNKWDLIKCKSFLHKDNHKWDKKTTSEWKKIFGNEASDKRLISKIYKQLMKLNNKKKKQTTQSKNGQKT